MRPTIGLNRCATDCRSLTLGGSFYHLSKQQVQEIMVDYQMFVNNLFDDTCVLEWTYNNRAVNDLQRSMKETDSTRPVLFLRGIVSNQTVYNKTTLREYCKKTAYSLSQNWAPMYTSVDYQSKKSQILRAIDLKSETLIPDLQKLFLLDSVYLNEYTMLDLSGHVCVKPTLSESNNLCGTLCLSVSFLCLEACLDDIADKMGVFVENLSNKYINISLTVGIETANHGSSFSDYLNYFGELYFDGFNSIHHNIGKKMIDQAQIVYLTRLGWTNTLSPLALSLRQQFPSTEKNDSTIEVKELPSGGLKVRYKKPVSTCKMSDYYQLKAEIYGALYPGGVIIPGRKLIDPMNNFLRPRWEYVPIFGDEIHIEEDSLRIQHRGVFNKEIIQKAFD